MKELKAHEEEGAIAPINDGWNPVKELKVCRNPIRDPTVPRLVESGEGIER